MSWSYDPTLSTDKDKVRLAIGDTDTNNQRFSDEEITATLTNSDSVLEAAAALAESLAARYATMVSISVDGLSKSNSDLSRNFALLAQRLRARATQEAAGLGNPVIAGVSTSDMLSVDQNVDRVPSQFKMGQFDNKPKEGGGDSSGLPSSNVPGE